MAWKLITFVACLPVLCSAYNNITSRILAAASHDNIDLHSRPITAEALASIESIYALRNFTIPPAISNSSRFDVHTHAAPQWYGALVPSTGGAPTPNSTLEAHLGFMASAGINHAVLSISTPGSTVYPGSQAKSVALARLLNEYLAALAYKLPHILSFFAVIPLPYTDAAITEADHALSRLNASGLGLLSNHEGSYLGHGAFRPFFAHVNSMANSTPIFIHPSGPCMHSSNGSLISANPTSYPEGFVEYYFETARTFMDLTLTRTIANLTSLKWVVSHAGGAFPAIEDRFLTSQPTNFQSESRATYATRFFWDSAGPVFPRQVLGLLGYEIPTSQLLYGSDFPYAPNYTYAYEIESIDNASFLSSEEKAALYGSNHRALFA